MLIRPMKCNIQQQKRPFQISYPTESSNFLNPLLTDTNGDCWGLFAMSLQWRHNDPDGDSNHRYLRFDGLFSRLHRRRSKKIPKLLVTGLCAENSLVAGEFPPKRPVTRKMLPLDDVIMYRLRSHTKRDCFLQISLYTGMSIRSYDTKWPPRSILLIGAEWHIDALVNEAIISSDNGLSSTWHQVNIWTTFDLLLMVHWKHMLVKLESIWYDFYT